MIIYVYWYIYIYVLIFSVYLSRIYVVFVSIVNKKSNVGITVPNYHNINIIYYVLFTLVKIPANAVFGFMVGRIRYLPNTYNRIFF